MRNRLKKQTLKHKHTVLSWETGLTEFLVISVYLVPGSMTTSSLLVSSIQVGTQRSVCLCKMRARHLFSSAFWAELHRADVKPLFLCNAYTATPTYLSIVSVKDHHSARARVHGTGDIMILHPEPHTTTLSNTQMLVSNILNNSRNKLLFVKQHVRCNCGVWEHPVVQKFTNN